jgi:hypothetical protein
MPKPLEPPEPLEPVFWLRLDAETSGASLLVRIRSETLEPVLCLTLPTGTYGTQAKLQQL